MDDWSGACVQVADRLHRRVDYDRNIHRICQRLGIGIRLGERSSVVPGPPPSIVLAPDVIGWSRSAQAFHEIAHLIVLLTGIEDDVMSTVADDQEARRMVERLCRLTMGVLQVPRPVLQRALRANGYGPAGLMDARREARVSVDTILTRWAHDDPDGERAAFVMAGSYVKKVEAHNMPAPFRPHDRVPEVNQVLPQAKVITVPGVGMVGMFVP